MLLFSKVLKASSAENLQSGHSVPSLCLSGNRMWCNIKLCVLFGRGLLKWTQRGPRGWWEKRVSREMPTPKWRYLCQWTTDTVCSKRAESIWFPIPSQMALFTPLFTQEEMWHGSLCPCRGLLYKSSTDCLIQAVQGEGFLSLYKGFLPSWLRMVKMPSFVLSFIIVFFVFKLIVFYRYFPFSLPVCGLALPPQQAHPSLLFKIFFRFFSPLLKIMFPFLTDNG